MPNPQQNLSFQYGRVSSVNLQDANCNLDTSYGTAQVEIMHGGSVVTIPKVGEYWSYYVNGTRRVLYERVSKETFKQEDVLREGDILIRAEDVLFNSAKRIENESDDIWNFATTTKTESTDSKTIAKNLVEIEDKYGEYMKSDTGLLNVDRQNGNLMYMVNSESDTKSITGQDIQTPCILAIISGDSVTFKPKK